MRIVNFFSNFSESKNFFSHGFFAFICLCFSFASFAQPAFEIVIGTVAYDDVKSIIQTYDSGYAVAGTTSETASGAPDIFLIKISSAGKVEWQKMIGTNSIERGNSIIQTPDSGFAIAGFTNSTGNYDVYLAKTDKNGSVQWTKTYGGSDWDFGNSVIQNSNGDYVIAGETFSSGKGNGDVFIMKTNSAGTLLWDTAYGGTAEDAAKTVCEAADGGYFITANTKSFGKGMQDVYLLKTNSGGNLLWEKTYGGTDDEIAGEGKLTSDNGFIVIGTNASFDTLQEFWLLKTDSAGDTLWTRHDKKTYNMQAVSASQTTDGGYIFGGNTDPFGQFDMYLYKTDGMGNYQNIRTYGGAEIENCFSVKQTFDGGYVLAGTTETYGMGIPNIYVIKTGSNLISTGTVVITVGINENETADKKIILYPNPASEKIFLIAEEKTFFEIFSSTGERIYSTSLMKGENSFNVSSFAAGMYFIKLRGEKYFHSGKLIITR